MLKQGPSRWLLALLLVSVTAAVLVAGPVIAGQKPVTKKVVKQVVKANTGVFSDSGPSGSLTTGSLFNGPPLAGLTLPKGSYALTAKVSLSALGGSGVATCGVVLDSSRQMDTAGVELSAAGADPQVATVPLQATFELKAQSRVDLRCSVFAAGVNFQFGGAKIQTVRGPTLSGDDNAVVTV